MNITKKWLAIVYIVVLSVVGSAGGSALAQSGSGFDPKYDINGDGKLDIADVSAASVYIQANYGATASQPPQSTPTAAAPTATAVPPQATATVAPTPIPPPQGSFGKCGESNSVWHPAVVMGCETGHEHGDEPPAWVLNAATPKPFTQSRESHTGYKGLYAKHSSGAESYLIGHILSTVKARSHGDHDYQLWLKTTDGRISYWEGMLCFANPCDAQPLLALSDNGQRPIILSQAQSGAPNGDGTFETWYGRADKGVIDLEWIIGERNASFDGTKSFGLGTKRTVAWFFYPDRFPADIRASMQKDCKVEFGICRLQFRADDRDYSAPGIVIPN